MSAPDTAKVQRGETAALKIEIAEAITRRLKGDGRSAKDMFGLALATIGEVTADLIFAAAQDEAHGDRLLNVFDMRVRARWAELASRE